MKRVIALVLTFVLVLSFAACGNKSEDGQQPVTQTKEQTTDQTKEEKPAEKPEEKAGWVPKETVNTIVPFKAGGAADLLTRSLSALIDCELIVTNIEGSSGLVGTQQVYDSEPDGYTLLSHNCCNLLANYLNGATEVSMAEELTLLGFMVADDICITTSKETGWKTLDEAIAYMKDNPGKIKVGLPGSASFSAALIQAILNKAEVEAVYVPYDGGAASRTALLSGEIQLDVTTGGDILSYVESGDIIPLVTCGEERSATYTEAPTLKELGYDIAVGLYRGIYGPPNMDEEIVEYFAEQFERAVKSEQFAADAANIGFVPNWVGPEEGKKVQQSIKELLAPVYLSMGYEAKP